LEAGDVVAGGVILGRDEPVEGGSGGLKVDGCVCKYSVIHEMKVNGVGIYMNQERRMENENYHSPLQGAQVVDPVSLKH
jgi:hypothetical protein